MVADIFFALIAIVMVALGWQSGAVAQLMRLVALFLAVVLGPVAAVLLREILFYPADTFSPGQHIIALILASVGIYIVGAIIGWVIARMIRLSSRVLTFLDRCWGAILAGVKACIIIVSGALILVMLSTPLSDHDPDNSLRLRDGFITGLVGGLVRYIPWQYEDINHINDCVAVAKYLEERSDMKILQQYPGFLALIAHPSLQQMLTDKHFIERAEKKDYYAVLSDEKVRILLKDDDFIATLRAAQCEEILEATQQSE